MGFFSKKKKLPQQEQPLLPVEIEIQTKVKRQDYIIAKKNEAEKQFEETGDIEKLLDYYNTLMADDECFSIRGSWVFRYPELLIKEKRYDEAWHILNKIYFHNPKLIGRISDMRWKILKAENRHHVDAIYHLMLATLFRFDGVTGNKKSYIEQEKKTFLRNAKPLAKKAGFSEIELEYLYYLIENEAMQDKILEPRLEKSYDRFLKDRAK